MGTGPVDRLHHIKDAIAAARAGVGGLTLEIVEANSFLSGGLSYQLLVIGEAARNIPDEWKQSLGPSINWRGVEDLGNRLRHAYHHTNIAILWTIYENELAPLEAAIDRMIAAHGPTSSRSPSS